MIDNTFIDVLTQMLNKHSCDSFEQLAAIMETVKEEAFEVVQEILEGWSEKPYSKEDYLRLYATYAALLAECAALKTTEDYGLNEYLATQNLMLDKIIEGCRAVLDSMEEGDWHIMLKEAY